MKKMLVCDPKGQRAGGGFIQVANQAFDQQENWNSQKPYDHGYPPLPIPFVIDLGQIVACCKQQEPHLFAHQSPGRIWPREPNHGGAI